MIKAGSALVCAMAMAASAGAAAAQDGRWAAGVTAGSDGLGADLKYALTPQIVLRARAAGLDIHDSEDSDGI
ncbi:hypothetical protein ABTC77_18950, partial [Acinetobacter baumannii]